jgi:hypothetical protein
MGQIPMHAGWDCRDCLTIIGLTRPPAGYLGICLLDNPSILRNEDVSAAVFGPTGTGMCFILIKLIVIVTSDLLACVNIACLCQREHERRLAPGLRAIDSRLPSEFAGTLQVEIRQRMSGVRMLLPVCCEGSVRSCWSRDTCQTPYLQFRYILPL